MTRRRLPPIPTIAIATLFLSGCALFRPAPPAVVTDAGCTVWRIYGPVQFSGLLDTPETVAQVRRVNAGMGAACGDIAP